VSGGIGISPIHDEVAINDYANDVGAVYETAPRQLSGNGLVVGERQHVNAGNWPT